MYLLKARNNTLIEGNHRNDLNVGALVYKYPWKFAVTHCIFPNNVGVHLIVMPRNKE